MRDIKKGSRIQLSGIMEQWKFQIQEIIENLNTRISLGGMRAFPQICKEIFTKRKEFPRKFLEKIS